MKCSECSNQMFVDYTSTLRDKTISRKRSCPNCGKIIRTIEVSKVEYNALKRLSQDLRWAVDRYLQGRKAV
jgi:transcriptional regulator NrdR family protein